MNAIAFDKSVRSYDKDGRLHIAVTNISKANVCPYMGKEIPNHEALGLDPNKIYKLYRHPDELKKAASTFNNIQLLVEHIPVSAVDHQPRKVIGSTGTDAVFERPYLRNSLVIWAKDDIEQVENKTKYELSSSYHYTPDMTPGVVDGESYDGVMREIHGNHVAIVEDGRAGADVVVGDSATIQQVSEKMNKTASKVPSPMALVAKGALLAYMQPKLAADANLDYKKILLGTTEQNWQSAKPVIVQRLKEAVEGKLAADASMDDVNAFLDRLDGKQTGEDEDPDEENGEDEDPDDKEDEDKGEDEDPDDTSEDADCEDEARPTIGIKAKDKRAKDRAARDKAAKDKAAKDKAARDKTAKDENMVTRKAMDAALASTVALVEQRMKKAEADRRQAERDVRPYVGTLDLAMDSAEEIYRYALESMDVDIDGLPPVAFRPLLMKLPKPSAPSADQPIAMDAAGEKSYLDRYPQATRLKLA